MPIVGYWPWAVALELVFSIINLCLVSNIFPFPVSKVKLIGDL